MRPLATVPRRQGAAVHRSVGATLEQTPRLIRSGGWRSLAVLAATCVITMASSAADGAKPTHLAPQEQTSIGPDQGPRVMALAAPWIDETAISPGFRFAGATIERAVACYLIDGPRRIKACLRPPTDAPPSSGVIRRALPGGVSLVLVEPLPPTADERALFEVLGGNLAQNAASAGLAQLWRQPEAAADPMPASTTIGMRLLDPLPWLALLLLWLLWASRKALDDLHGRGWPFWLALLGISAWTRLSLSVRAPMTAWSWTRISTIGEQLWSSPTVQALLQQQNDRHTTLDDLQSMSAVTLSIVTPLALLGHARKLFGDAHSAYAAAMLLAVSPHAIRFASADTQFNVSMFWSSVAFFWLYAALDAHGRRARLVYAIGLLPLLALAMTARPLNVMVGPLIISALWIATTREHARWRAALALEAGLISLWAFWHFVSLNGDSLNSLTHETTVFAVLSTFFSFDYNPLTFWRLTPPAWLLLIGLGAVSLIRAPWPSLAPTIARRRGIWLLCWMLGYILLHGVIRPEEPLNHARYQLHSLPAMALLAGAGLAAWWRTWRSGERWRLVVVASVAALCLASPWIHAPAIGDVAFVTMQEHAFLERMRDPTDPSGGIAADCTVLEVMRPSNQQVISKIERVGRLARREGGIAHLWATANVQSWPDGELTNGAGDQASTADMPTNDDGSLPAGTQAALANIAASVAASKHRSDEPRPALALISQRGREFLANPPACLYFYEGPECAGGPHATWRHPACREILASGSWQLVAEDHQITRIYDEPLVTHLRANGDPLELRMWRRVGAARN